MPGFASAPTPSQNLSIGGPLLYPVIKFGDLNTAEASIVDAWFFGGPQFASFGAYSLEGQPATFARTFNMSADSGAYTVSGQTANFNASRSLSADVGSEVYTGLSAELYRLGPTSQWTVINNSQNTDWVLITVA